jgi:hypothetical protein
LSGQWQIPKNQALKAQANRLQRSVTHRLNEWRNEHWSDALESLDCEDKLLWKMTKTVIEFPLFRPPASALSDSVKADALDDSLDVQFEPVDELSNPAITKIFYVATRAYEYALLNEPTLINPSEVLQTIKRLEVGKSFASCRFPVGLSQ